MTETFVQVPTCACGNGNYEPMGIIPEFRTGVPDNAEPDYTNTPLYEDMAKEFGDPLTVQYATSKYESLLPAIPVVGFL